MIVRDIELRNLIEQRDNPLLTNFDVPKDWASKDSLVQPCSLDLHVGDIYQPGVKPGKAGSATSPRSQLVLSTGQTAVITTKESIHLTADYAAFGFPPSSVSSKALLMTNPGHIDPGFTGTLQFTVINMGRENYVLRKNDLIVTLLIFKLASEVGADYSSRRKDKNPSMIEQVDIDTLSPDFVDVQKRASSIAKKTLGWTTLGASVLAVVLGWAFTQIDKRLNGFDEIQNRLTRVEDENLNLS